MPDYRRIMDPGPNDPTYLELARRWNPQLGMGDVYDNRTTSPLSGVPVDQSIGAPSLSLEALPPDDDAFKSPLQQIPEGLSSIGNDIGRDMSGLYDQVSSGLGSVGGAISNGLGALGSAASRGLNAITPSQDTLNSIGMRLQNMGAAYTGQTPLYMKQLQMMHEMGQTQELMQMRRAQLAQQMAQQQEMKRGHDLGLLEKALSHPKGSALLEQLANDPNFSLSHQAALLHKGFKEADFGSFEAYKEFIPEDVQQRFIAGKLPAHELNAWLDEARTATKENAKANAKQAILTRAINKPADQRTPREALLVEEHQAALEVEKLKPKKMQSEIDENQAQAEHYRKQAETGGSDKLMGVDREAITQELYGPKTRYSTLDQKKMKQVNDRLLNFQGTQQLNKSMAIQQAQLQVPDKPSQSDREKTAEDLSVFDALDNLNNLYSSDFVGPARGRAGAFMETFGGITTDEAKFRASNAALKNHMIKMITGAQMSEPESQRIREQIPEPHNPPEVWEARLQQTRKNAKFLADRRREVLKGSGIDVSGLPEIGKKKQQSPQVDKQKFDKVQSVLDEVLGK
jgi:hypothetical protein